jgi:hypothetical protein
MECKVHILEMQRVYKEHYKFRANMLHHYLRLYTPTDQIKCKITSSLEQYVHKLVRKLPSAPGGQQRVTPIVDRLCESAEEFD